MRLTTSSSPLEKNMPLLVRILRGGRPTSSVSACYLRVRSRHVDTYALAIDAFPRRVVNDGRALKSGRRLRRNLSVLWLIYTRAFTHLLFQVLALLICQEVVVQPRSRPPAELLYKRLRKRPGRLADREVCDTSPSSWTERSLQRTCLSVSLQRPRWRERGLALRTAGVQRQTGRQACFFSA